MALYEITQDCRIANNEYQKWDVVSDTEIGWFYPTVMKPTNWEPKKVKKVVEKSELKDEENTVVKPTKKWRKKK